jgi:hypothetical protein
VKFASQTGIIVSEQLMREHFSVFGLILDATIRTITIDEVSIHAKCFYTYYPLLMPSSTFKIVGLQPLKGIWLRQLCKRRNPGWPDRGLQSRRRAPERHSQRRQLPLRGGAQAPAEQGGQ